MKHKLLYTLILDKDWKKDKTITCPFCKNKGLMEDTNPKKEATHYCSACGEGMIISGSVNTRTGVM